MLRTCEMRLCLRDSNSACGFRVASSFCSLISLRSFSRVTSTVFPEPRIEVAAPIGTTRATLGTESSFALSALKSSMGASEESVPSMRP